MSEKTPYQIMRERQEAVIKKQKQDADNRVEAYKLSIQFNTQEELNEKLEAKKKEIRRLDLEKRIAEIEAEETSKRIAENKKRIQRRAELKIESDWLDQHAITRPSYSSSSSSSNSHSSYDGGSSSSSDSSSSCDSGGSSGCD